MHNHNIHQRIVTKDDLIYEIKRALNKTEKVYTRKVIFEKINHGELFDVEIFWKEISPYLPLFVTYKDIKEIAIANKLI